MPATDKILLTMPQFLDMWNYGRHDRMTYEHLKKNLKIYKTQMPSKYINGRNEIIYCLELLEWIDSFEHLKLENNDLYQAALRGITLEKYRCLDRKGYYNYKDIIELLGVGSANAKEIVKKHPNKIKIKSNFYIPKPIFDEELKIKKFRERKTELEQKVKSAIIAHQKKLKVINEIDNEKMKLMHNKHSMYDVFVKTCRDDCLKGQNGDCPFYESRDNEGLRSSCIYLRHHALDIMNEIRQYFKNSMSTFKNFTKKQKLKHLIEAELALKYKYLQLPYTDTVVKDKNGVASICKYESTLIKDSAFLSQQWESLGISPPEMKNNKKEIGNIIDSDEWNNVLTNPLAQNMSMHNIEPETNNNNMLQTNYDG